MAYFSIVQKDEELKLAVRVATARARFAEERLERAWSGFRLFGGDAPSRRLIEETAARREEKSRAVEELRSYERERRGDGSTRA